MKKLNLEVEVNDDWEPFYCSNCPLGVIPPAAWDYEDDWDLGYQCAIYEASCSYCPLAESFYKKVK